MSEGGVPDDQPDGEGDGSYTAPLALLTCVVLIVVFFQDIRSGFEWWYDWSVGFADGSWILFLIGLGAALFIAFFALIAVWLIYVAIGKLGSAFARGWRKARAETRD